jgi:hypothetical protein
VFDLRETLREFDDVRPPEALRRRILRDAASVLGAAPQAGANTGWPGLARPLAWAVGGLAAALVLGLLVIAAHTRDAHAPQPPARQTNQSHVVSANGVRLTVPRGWSAVRPASDAPVTDPRTLLVVGTAEVHAQASQCQIGGKYHVPAEGAVVVVVGWLSSSAGGGPVTAGRAALRHLTSVHKPSFECYAGRGAVAQVRLGGRDYQVNVMVGDRASQQRIAQALAVARSFDLASSGSGKADPHTVIDVTGAIGGIHTSATRLSVERTLGSGATISTVTRHPKTGSYTLQRVAYPASRLVVLYFASPNHLARVFGVFTRSPRYHTADGLRVGSTLGQARSEPGIRCSQQDTWIACQGGLGYQHPLTSFIVKGGHVVRVFVAAAAD